MTEKHCWTTHSGEKMDIVEMETSHIQNALKYLERKAEAGVEVVRFLTEGNYDGDASSISGDVAVVDFLQGEEWLLEVPEYLLLEEELRKREDEVKCVRK